MMAQWGSRSCAYEAKVGKLTVITSSPEQPSRQGWNKYIYFQTFCQICGKDIEIKLSTSNSFNRQLDSLWNSWAGWNLEIAKVRSLMSCLAISQFYNKAYCGLNCLTLKIGIEQISIGHWSTVVFSSRILNQPCYSCLMLNSQSTAFIDKTDLGDCVQKTW